MGRKIAKFIIKCGKWEYNKFPDIKRAVVLMAPHTSMLDFYYGKLYFIMYGHKPAFLIKKEMFFWPLGPILKKLGGFPVDRGKRNAGITEKIVKAFQDHNNDEFYIVITPEGTRKRTKNWKRGFIRIAKEASVPVILGFINYGKKEMGVMGSLNLSGTDDEIMERLKKKYIGMEGKKPELFETGYE